MRIWLFALAAFAAGLAAWNLTLPAQESARAIRKAASNAVVRARPPETNPLAHRVRDLRRRLALYRAVPLRELVLYGKEPLAARIRRARGLPAAERRNTLLEWARGAVYKRKKAREMLALVREEEDRGLLLQLAEMIDHASLVKMTSEPTFTDEEKEGIFQVARAGEPPARRIAALRVIGGDRVDGQPPRVQALLADVLRSDPEPAVVAAAAEEVEQRYAPESMAALLEAHRRLRPGKERQQVARAYAKWTPWEELRKRFHEARGPVEFDAWARAWSSWLTFGKRNWDSDLPDIYRQIGARDIRRGFFLRLANTIPPHLDLMRRLARMEADADLRARYLKVLAAADPNDPVALTRIDVQAILYK